MGMFRRCTRCQRRLTRALPVRKPRRPAEHDLRRRVRFHAHRVESEEKRYESVVAAAAMRAMFPQDAARRRVPANRSVLPRRSPRCRSSFPSTTATEAFAQGAGGGLEKKDLKVGFIPITCATPIIMAHPMGFYAKHGLNVDVVKTAGWAIIRDKTINKEYDAAHMLSPMPLAISLGLGSQAIPFAVPAIENINGQGITLAIKHKDKRDPKSWKGFKFAIPVRLLEPQLSAALLSRRARHRSRQRRAAPRRAAARNGRQPARRQHRRVPRARQHLPARDLRRCRVPPHPVQGDLGRTPVLRLRGQQGVHRSGAQQLRRPDACDRRCHDLRVEGGEPQGDRRNHRARGLSQPAGHRDRAVAHRHLRGRARRHQDATRSGSISIRSRGSRSPCGC